MALFFVKGTFARIFVKGLTPGTLFTLDTLAVALVRVEDEGGGTVHLASGKLGTLTLIFVPEVTF